MGACWFVTEGRGKTHCWKCGLILERRGDTLVCTTPWEEEKEDY